MRPLYIAILATCICTFNYEGTVAQIRANFIETSSQPTQQQIEEYRTSIWENLPSPDGWTNDFEGIFSVEEEQALTDLITRLEERTGIEIALITVDSNMVSLDKFENFADHVLNTWGVGKTQSENGIVICISSQYKKITISRGVGIDKYLTDALVAHLIAKSFIPQYRKRNYFGGTINGLTALISNLQPTI